MFSSVQDEFRIQRRDAVGIYSLQSLVVEQSLSFVETVISSDTSLRSINGGVQTPSIACIKLHLDVLKESRCYVAINIPLGSRNWPISVLSFRAGEWRNGESCGLMRLFTLNTLHSLFADSQHASYRLYSAGI